MSEKKLTPDQIRQLKDDKISGMASGRFQDKGLVVRIPSQSLINGSNAGDDTSDIKEKDKDKKD